MNLVAITGWAWRTPLGSTVEGAEGVVAALLGGASAIRRDPRFDTSSYPSSLGATVALRALASSRKRRHLGRMACHALDAADEAMRSLADAPIDGRRVGMFSAVGALRASWDELMPALEHQRDAGGDSWGRGLSKLHPLWMLRYLSNAAQSTCAEEHELRGDGVVHGGGVAGAEALASAARALVDRRIDRALVLAHDSLLDPETLLERGVRGAFARCPDPGQARPAYDEAASGAVPGEAAAAIVLERVEDAGARALARIAAEVGADGMADEPRGETLSRVFRRLARPGAIIDGAARALPPLDRAERTALSEACPSSQLTTLTGAMGSLGAAAPLVQAIALAGSLRAGLLYPVAGLRAPSPGPLVPITSRVGVSTRHALALSTAPPGLAACILVELP